MYTRILVPLDGSDAAEGALAHAAQMADIFDAELILLRATFIPDLPDLDLSEAQNILIKESEAYLCDAAGRLKGRGRGVRTVVRWSEAAEAIIDDAVAQEVSVVVMATHGYRGPERWPMGSVAEKVLRSMRVPVLLIRAPSASDERSRTGQSVT
jgi:nucleotide-binding universal stress UspA family protein